MSGEFGQLDVDSGTQTSSQVRGAGQDVAQVLIPHELMTFLSNQRFYLLQSVAEPLKHL